MTEIILGFVSSLIGGVLVAFVNHWYTRRKTEAETEKLKAEANNINVQTKKLLVEIDKLNSSVEESNYYKKAQAKEIVLYNSKQSMDELDFEGQREKIPDDPRGIVATCSLSVRKGALILQRTNTGSRYLINLHRYSYDEKPTKVIPRNELLPGERKLHFICEAKVTKGNHTLLLVIKEDSQKGIWLAQKKFPPINNIKEWIVIEWRVRIPSTGACFFRIDDREVTQNDSSLHLQNLLLTEIVE